MNVLSAAAVLHMHVTSTVYITCGHRTLIADVQNAG